MLTGTAEERAGGEEPHVYGNSPDSLAGPRRVAWAHTPGSVGPPSCGSVGWWEEHRFELCVSNLIVLLSSADNLT